ncbi:MAG: hypothetical protein A3H28_05140 [Acidobacteria bacterium RIFCSPLOWO2_02_FULL_61_28]|nr:MAG: hypothetical protein A3H28_05140 [Acidobacteria bacterium RIFCSPLOWO2_02_FULL_61_28]
MITRRRLVLAILAGQVLLMVGLIAQQEYRLATWDTIRLPVIPVDPVALFRGRYVRLGYDFLRIETTETDWKSGDVIYLRLAPDTGGLWRLAGFGHTPDKPPGEVLVRGRIRFTSTPHLYVETGIESYFLSERKAPQVEQLMGKQYRITVDVAVSADGATALKQLYVEGIPAERFEP